MVGQTIIIDVKHISDMATKLKMIKSSSKYPDEIGRCIKIVERNLIDGRIEKKDKPANLMLFDSIYRRQMIDDIDYMKRNSKDPAKLQECIDAVNKYLDKGYTH